MLTVWQAPSVFHVCAECISSHGRISQFEPDASGICCLDLCLGPSFWSTCASSSVGSIRPVDHIFRVQYHVPGVHSGLRRVNRSQYDDRFPFSSRYSWQRSSRNWRRHSRSMHTPFSSWIFSSMLTYGPFRTSSPFTSEVELCHFTR